MSSEAVTPVHSKAIKVLLIEQDGRDAGMVRETLAREHPGDFEVTHLTQMSEAVAHLARGGVDVVLLAMGLPGAHGMANLQHARAAAPSAAIVLLLRPEDEALAGQAIREGAQDYLLKGKLEHRALCQVLYHTVGRHHMERERERIHRGQFELRDEFLSRVSHQLQSPLASMHSLTALVTKESGGKSNPQQNEYLQIILSNVLQLQKMMGGLLEITQVQAGKLMVRARPFSLKDVVTEAATAFQEEAASKEIVISSRCSSDLPQVYADGQLTFRVLSILLDNAVKFTPQRGTIHIEASIYEKEPAYLVVEVRDTGCGIEPEATAHIFDHLYQVTDPAPNGEVGARRGLGLGLHIGRELMSRLGGEIWVASEPRKGSRFYITLPIFSPGARAPAVTGGSKTRRHKPFPFIRWKLRFIAAFNPAGPEGNPYVLCPIAGSA